MKLVVVAERSAPCPQAVLDRIAASMVHYYGGELAVRGPRGGGPTSLIEQQAIEMAGICRAEAVVYVPAQASDSRASIFKRDYEMVTGADLVLAFFSDGSDMEGGTGHVVKAAIDREVAIEAYSITESGGISLMLSDAGPREGEEAFSGTGDR